MGGLGISLLAGHSVKTGVLVPVSFPRAACVAEVNLTETRGPIFQQGSWVPRASSLRPEVVSQRSLSPLSPQPVPLFGCIFSLPTHLVPTPCRSPSSLIYTEPLVVIPTPAPPPLLVLFAEKPDYISLLSNDIFFVLVYPTRLPVAQEQGCLIFSCAL